MIHRTPSKIAVFGIAAWWTLIVFEPGNAFRNPALADLMALCRSEWVVALITGALAALLLLDLMNKAGRTLVRFAWAASMVWWLFVAICIAFERLLATGTGAYLAFAYLAASAWWQRKDETASG